jgi:hypothetical protein
MTLKLSLQHFTMVYHLYYKMEFGDYDFENIGLIQMLDRDLCSTFLTT